ncbi:MAG: hypothetical protein FWG63_02755 [Defluviitaleaceae bacterium]|nr:hypothetical protein [Defluviitaleaceae bacterium]
MRIGAAQQTSLVAQRQLNNVNNMQNRTNERLATGRQINRAADNAAGLAISEGLINQIRGLDRAIENSRDGMSLLRTADGAMEGVGDMLGRVRELTVQASNGILTNDQRNAIGAEISQLLSEIDTRARNTEFNQRPILDGSASSQFNLGTIEVEYTVIVEVDDPDDPDYPYFEETRIREVDLGSIPGRNNLNLQTGANAGQMLNVAVQGVNVDNLGLRGFADIFETANQTGVAPGAAVLSNFLANIDSAVNGLSAARAELGSVENRLNHTVNNLSEASNNMSAANSRIRDADMAREVTNNHRNNALQQAALAMAAQANSQMGAGLRLLG